MRSVMSAMGAANVSNAMGPGMLTVIRQAILTKSLARIVMAAIAYIVMELVSKIAITVTEVAR